MSWSLELRDGDFTTTAASLGTVAGAKKLLQDLRLHILERMGTDDLHPSYGSLIDGGTTPDGIEHQGVVGEANLRFVVGEVEAEITRIIRERQGTQLERAKRDHFVLGRPTLDRGEVIISLDDLNFVQRQDALIVRVTIRTGTDESFNLDVPVDSPTLSAALSE